jgi:aspartyl protease family protein
VPRLLWVLLACLALLFVILMLHQDQDSVGGLPIFQFANLGIKILLLVFIGSWVLVAFRDRFSQAVQSLLIWVVIALVLVAFYTYRFDLRDAADRVLAELIPGHAAIHGHAVELARSHGGDFPIPTQVNGAHVSMILDTGATAVVLTSEAAKAAGLPLEMMRYSVDVETANGHTMAAPVTLDRIVVGDISEHSVPALVAQPGQLKTSLLGMSFLNRLEGWEVRGDKLVMRGSP